MGQFHLGILPDRPAAEVAALAETAERHGLEGFWVADSQSIFRDVFGCLTLAAARTRRILLGTGVATLVTRHPAVLAGAFATLDEQSGGRAVAGLGVGGSGVATLGLPKSTLAELERMTDALRALTAGEPCVWDGREIRVSWARRRLPVYFASSGPRSLRLAGRLADGVMFQVGADPKLVGWALAQVEAGAREAGRDAGAVKRLVRLACTLGDDRDRARAGRGATPRSRPRRCSPQSRARGSRTISGTTCGS
jgi:5,10-methylenetetrahydromethanopterin reductase